MDALIQQNVSYLSVLQSLRHHNWIHSAVPNVEPKNQTCVVRIQSAFRMLFITSPNVLERCSSTGERVSFDILPAKPPSRPVLQIVASEIRKQDGALVSISQIRTKHKPRRDTNVAATGFQGSMS